MRRRRPVGAPQSVGAVRGRAATARLAVAVVASLCVLSACRPLYIPLVPDAPEAPTALRLSDDSALDVVAGRPRLGLTIDSTDAALAADGVWLNVQWFGPSGRQAASESLWVEGQPGAATMGYVFVLPVDVTVVLGEWRAVVSADGVLLRQFRVDVVADPEG